MKHARVIVDGTVHGATERDGQVLLQDGRRFWPDQVRSRAAASAVAWSRWCRSSGRAPSWRWA